MNRQAAARVLGAVRTGARAGARTSARAASLGLRAAVRRSRRLPDLPPLPEGRWLDLPGRGRAFVIDTGAPTPGAPTLLLFHGLATTALLTWFSVVEDLSREYRVVMFDQRWHGRGIPADRFRLDDCADDAAAVLDALAVDRAVCVGYSLGGALAQTFWHRHPERVAGLVLCSTAMTWRGHAGEAGFYLLLRLLNLPLRSRGRTRVAALLASLPESAIPGPDLSTWAWAEFRSTSAWSLPEVLGELGGFDAQPWMARVDVPTAVVVTARDRAIPTARQRRLAETVPGATVLEAPGGHTSIVFDPEHWRPLFLQAVRDVVERTGARVG